MSSRFLIPVVVAALNATAGAQLCFEDRSVPLPAGTIALTHADMDGDGDVDLVVGYLHGSFSVFLNDGAGNFIESAQYPLGPDVYGMAAGDLNGDGKADVVTASALSPNSISVFYNSGNGLLSAAVPLPAPGYPSSMAVVDMDGDSDNDIVVVGYWGASVWVLRNGGSGTFGTYDTHPALAGAQGLAVGDLSGDGLPDLVVGDGDSDRISVYLSSPSGLSAQFTYPTGPGPYYPAIGDFDGDGQADVAVADFNGNLHPGNIRIFHNTGGGILNSQADIPTGVIGPICIGTSDFDADGDVDIAATTYFGSDVVILENDGAGAFPRRTLAHAGDDLYGMTIADFNGDGKPDVAASAWGASPPRAAVFLQCPGSPSPGLCLDDTSVPVVAGPVAITDADMDLDGDLDLVVGYLHGDFSVFMNDGDGGFALSATYPLGPDIYGVAAGDLNGDDYPDIVSASALSPNTVSVFYNLGDGLLGPAVGLDSPAYPSSMAVVDMDGDTLNDIVVVGFWDGLVSVIRNLGGGSFAGRSNYAAQVHPQGLAVGDLNGDGRPDLVVGNGDSGTISVYRSSPAGLLGQDVYQAGSFPYYPAIGDFNHDGLLDVAAAACANNGAPGTVRIFLNIGGGVLAFGEDVPTGAVGPLGIAAADFDGDDDTDIATATNVGGSLVLLPNDGTGSFPVSNVIAAGGDLYGLVVGDYNDDGQPDVATAVWGSSPPRAAVFLHCAAPHENQPPICILDTTEADERFLQPSPHSYVVTEDETLAVDFIGTDPDGDPLSAAITSGPDNATLTMAGSVATVTWTPTAADKALTPVTIAVTFTDPSGASATCSIDVIDINLRPQCDAGGDEEGRIVVEGYVWLGAIVLLEGSAADADDPHSTLTYRWEASDHDVVLVPADQSFALGLFPFGVTTATLTVADGRGGVTTCDVSVVVQDTTPPQVQCSTSTSMLWPANHKMVGVTVFVHATDACWNPAAILPLTVTVRSNEPDDAPGGSDGATTGDVAGQNGYATPIDISNQLNYSPLFHLWWGTIQLRAERSDAGPGRAYSIDVKAIDASGNVATTSRVVVVPHDRR